MKNGKYWIVAIAVGVFAFGIGKWSGQKSTTVVKTEDNAFRTISGIEIGEQEIINEISSGRNNDGGIIAIKTKEELEQAIDKLQTHISAHPDYKIVHIYAHFFRPLKKMRGIIWRMRPLIEKCGSCHIQALNLIKNFYYRSYLFGPHVNTLLDYIVEPNPNAKPFSNVEELQVYAEKHLIPAFRDSADQIANIVKGLPEDFEFSFDNYLITGFDSANNIRFVSDARRYKRVVKGNLELLLAQKYRMLGFMQFSVNYNWNNVTQFLAHMVKKTALNNVFGTLPENATPRELLKYLAKSKFKKIGTARVDHWERNKGSYGSFEEKINANLKEAHKSFINAIRFRRDGIQNSIAQSTGANEEYLLRPAALTVNDENIVENLTKRLEIFENALSGEKTEITSKATGETFYVNPGAFFKYHQDLKKVFLPKNNDGAFASIKRSGCLGMNNKIKRSTSRGAAKTCAKNSVTGKRMTMWDYTYGKPVEWYDHTLGGLIPGTNKENFYSRMRSLKLTPATRRMGLVLPLL